MQRLKYARRLTLNSSFKPWVAAPKLGTRSRRLNLSLKRIMSSPATSYKEKTAATKARK
jgi:hypothetical protein